MPGHKAWVHRLSGLIKRGRKHKHFRRNSIKVENVSWKRISKIDLNCFQLRVPFSMVVSNLIDSKYLSKWA